MRVELKRRNLIKMSLAVGVCFSLAGCAVKLPKITATGEKTAFENQIIGSYQLIEEESWMVASVRAGNSEDSLTITEQKRRVLEAFQRQRFNADDIEDFKQAGVAGERNDGLLEIRVTERYLQDTTYRALVDKIMGEENEDRSFIMQRIVDLHPEIDPDDRARVGQVFARLKQESSPEGCWIQQPDGVWRKK